MGICILFSSVCYPSANTVLYDCDWFKNQTMKLFERICVGVLSWSWNFIAHKVRPGGDVLAWLFMSLCQWGPLCSGECPLGANARDRRPSGHPSSLGTVLFVYFTRMLFLRSFFPFLVFWEFYHRQSWMLSNLSPCGPREPYEFFFCSLTNRLEWLLNDC